ncbi:hypothetical protein SINDD18_00525 [Streptococcus infantis]|uniref:Uncharacterized protein n=1 Tax=Streptococcus infantis TaxID=68892 RepID=A0A139RHW4_9STRE|nr:hypothetical protein SINDD18_00525 [Streptococcus infantis]
MESSNYLLRYQVGSGHNQFYDLNASFEKLTDNKEGRLYENE